MTVITKLESLENAVRSKINISNKLTLLEIKNHIDNLNVGESTYLGIPISNFVGDITFSDKTTLERPNGTPSLNTSLEDWNVIRDYGFSYAFTGCSNLTSVDFSNVTSVDTYGFSYSFNECSNLTSVDFSNVTSVDTYGFYYAFNNCPKLTSVDFSNVTSVGDSGFNYAFSDCSNLTSADFSNVTSVDTYGFYYAFNNCPNLTSVDFSNVTSVDTYGFSYSFNNCPKLTSLEFPSLETVTASTSSGSSQFGNNSYIEKMYFPRLSSITNKYLFNTKCSKLKTLYFSDSNKSALEATTGYATQWGLGAGFAELVYLSDAERLYQDIYNSGKSSFFETSLTQYKIGDVIMDGVSHTPSSIDETPLHVPDLYYNYTPNLILEPAPGEYHLITKLTHNYSWSKTQKTVSNDNYWHLRFKTTENNSKILLPFRTCDHTIDGKDFSLYDYPCRIDWGDGSSTILDTPPTGNKGTQIYPLSSTDDRLIHTYIVSGTYDVKIYYTEYMPTLLAYNASKSTISDSYPYNYFRKRLVEIVNSIPPQIGANTTGTNGSLFSLFLDCSLITSLPEDLFKTYEEIYVNNIDSLFYGCSSLTSIPEALFSPFNKGTISNMNHLFFKCSALTTLPSLLFSNNMFSTNPSCTNFNNYSNIKGTADNPLILYNNAINLSKPASSIYIWWKKISIEYDNEG